MTFFQSIILGVVQGLTEFLPISSTAHLRIVPALCGWSDPGAAFTAVIQLGTLIAVLIYFRRDIVEISTSVVEGIATRDPLKDHRARLGWMVAAGTIPIVLCGLIFKDFIETSLRSLYVISASMIVLALVMIVAERVFVSRQRKNIPLKTIERLSWGESIWVGIAQAVALIPGSSRSGTTITGGLLVGMDRETAARFSFILSLPSIFAAGIFELIKEREALLSTDVGVVNVITATIVSGVVGYASIAFLLGYLKKHSTWLFIIYRILAGTTLAAMLRIGILLP